MSTKITLFLLLTVCCFLKSSFSADPRVYGGEELEERCHKHLVELDIKMPKDDYLCSGSIIHSSWILSAAHCVYSKPTAIFFFHFKNGKRIQIAEMDKAFIHPDYKQLEIVQHTDEKANDVSLMKTKKKITFDKYVQPIPLAIEPVATNSEGIIAGFGDSEDSGPKQGKVILYYCGERTGVMCSIGSVRTGGGDSGGPLIVNGRLSGVNAASCEDYHNNTNCEAIYANMIENKEWIMSITRCN